MKVFISGLDLHNIMVSGQCFRMEDIFETDQYTTYSITAHRKYLEIDDYCDGRFEFHCSEQEYNEIWVPYFDLKNDLYTNLQSDDEFVQRSINVCSGVKILNQDFYETLISFIISQRKSIPAIRTSVERLCEKFGNPIKNEQDHIVSYAFPSPFTLAEKKPEDFDGCGLGYRAEYIIDASKWYIDKYYLGWENTVSYSELLEELMKIKGVGIKVANCTCLFGAHKLNACPIDVWMQKVIDENYAGTKPDWMNSDIAGVYQQFVFMYKRLYEEKTE